MDTSVSVLWGAEWPVDPDGLRKQVGALYSLKKSHLFNVVFTLNRNMGDAEDITQETFLRFYAYLKSGRQVTGDPMNWLVCVAKNIVIDRARRSGRERTGQESDWRRFAKRGDCKASPESLAILTRQQQETDRLIGSLEGLQRQCLILRLRGVSFREIADSLNVSMSVAVDQTNRAIEKVKRRARK
jgi:RNA polymerase sigma-70 factor (ECF subfamily)